MNTTKTLIIALALAVSCGTANAQFGGLRRAVQRGVEKAVEKKAEEKAAEAADKAADKALESAEKQRQRGEAALGKALNQADSIAEANAVELDASEAAAAPEIAATPYTPSENEFAYFGMKKGLVQVVAVKDAKGKITSQTRSTITGITGAKDAFAVNYQSETLDAKGNPADKDKPIILHFRVIVKDGAMFLDMKGMFGAMDGLDAVQVTGSPMQIPNSLKVGQTLPDASSSVRIGFIRMNVQMTDGKVEAEESVTTAAGTFKCFRISQKTKAMGVSGSTLTWYAKGIGAVKSETYDAKGKLAQSTELISSL